MFGLDSLFGDDEDLSLNTYKPGETSSIKRHVKFRDDVMLEDRPESGFTGLMNQYVIFRLIS